MTAQAALTAPCWWRCSLLAAQHTSFAAGSKCLLVGGSLAHGCQGLRRTVGVTPEAIRHPTKCVTRSPRWLVTGGADRHQTGQHARDRQPGNLMQRPDQAIALVKALIQI